MGIEVTDLAPGDVILFTDYAGTELPKAHGDDPTLILMGEADAIATLEA